MWKIKMLEEIEITESQLHFVHFTPASQSISVSKMSGNGNRQSRARKAPRKLLDNSLRTPPGRVTRKRVPSEDNNPVGTKRIAPQSTLNYNEGTGNGRERTTENRSKLHSPRSICKARKTALDGESARGTRHLAFVGQYPPEELQQIQQLSRDRIFRRNTA